MFAASTESAVEDSRVLAGEAPMAQEAMENCHESDPDMQSEPSMDCCITGEGCQHDACDMSHCQVHTGLTSQLYPMTERNAVVMSLLDSAYLSQTPELSSPPPIF